MTKQLAQVRAAQEIFFIDWQALKHAVAATEGAEREVLLWTHKLGS